MTTQRLTDQWRYRRHSLSVLMLFLTVALSLWLTKPAQAATTTISDQASCEAFGGSVQSGACEVRNPKTIAAGDTLVIQFPTEFIELTNNGTLVAQARTFIDIMLRNNAGATVNAVDDLSMIQFLNQGVINITGDMTLLSSRSLNISDGQIYVRNGGNFTIRTGTGFLDNDGTITIECGGVMIYQASGLTGNPPKDICPPDVTVNQAVDQADPTNRNPLLFTATFRQAVTGFTAADVILGGTADRSGATVTVSGGPNSYTISVNGIAGNGTVTAAVPANAATDAEGQGNPASTNTDNRITFIPDFTAPLANPQPSPAALANGWTNRDVTVLWNWGDTGGSDIDLTRCTQNSTTSGEGEQTLTATCQDRVGNVGTASYTAKVDKSAPVANPTQSPAAAPSGWNNTAVTVSWNWSDPATSPGAASGIDSANCTASSVASGSATVTVTATCRDLAGNSGTASYSVRIDPTAPTANPSQSPAANAAGWNNTDVTVDWNWTFTGAIIDTANCTTSSSSSGEGTLTLSATCRDVATNQRTVTYGVKVDKTAPVVTVTGVSAGASYPLGSVPTAACSTTDAISGVATQATLSVTGGNPDGTGNFTATCSGATDVASNSAAPVSVNYSVTPPPDTTAPVITAQVNGTLGNNGWYVSDVSVSWTVVDNESTISSQSGCETQNITGDTAGETFTCSATSAGGTASESVTVKRDATAPTISAAASSGPNGNGWYNSNVTVQFTCNDNLSGVVSCPTDETLSSEGAAVASTAQTITDQAGNSSAPSNVVTVQIDKTAPVVTITGVNSGASYPLGSVPTAGCSPSDTISGVATQATVSVTGGNAGTGTFTATCSGAADNAGNSAAPVSVSYTVTAPVDACTTTALRDDFNRANGSLGSNWAGLTGQSFYKIASNQVDVQLGGPVLWKPTTFGVNQAAFVTLSTLDAYSPSQGVLLKVQSGSIPNAGAISVVYDSLAKAVRVSTLRLNALAWTSYGHTPATVANGDQLLGCVQADGTVRVYQNSSLLTTVTLNAADQSFFNGKGGKIGLWTVAALNATFDDFGGGALTGVTSATLDATVPDELADDGAEITVAENFPTDDAAVTPDAGAFANRAFLPLVTR